ncbi:MAG: MFS transporter [Porticoccaceae bacterium]|nr:MFS transporter [Pseudomonadales bacterium]
MELIDADKSYKSKKYRYYVLGIFSVTYMFNFVDRQILAILQEPIKVELGLSDTQLGLLTGFAFAVFYITMGLPIARLADRSNRRNIVASCLGLWSLMTAVCGLAQSYVQLLFARMGVGVGEAGCSPPIHSMISDIFPLKERASALGFYNSGVNVGMLVGFLLGGWLQEYFGWRVALMAVGIPGLLLAVLMRFTVAEPPRLVHSSAQAKNADQLPSFADTVQLLWSKKTFRLMVLGGSMCAFTGYCLFSWTPSFLIRSYGLSTGTIGTWLAISIGVGGALGTWATGYFADKFAAKDVRWYPWILVATYGLPLPFVIAMFFSTSGIQALMFFIVPAILLAGYLAPLITVTHSLVEPGMRAVSSAIVLLMVNLIGLGLGPVSVGMLSDYLEPDLGPESLRYALFLFTSISLILSMILFIFSAKYIRVEMVVSERSDH